MGKNLVIVESPAKAKTIEKVLGKEYTVKSSYGHVRDLSPKGISIDIENGFQPQYQISDDKKKIVKELKEEAIKSDTIWLATDEDREGEAISWHLIKALSLPQDKTKRITFNEITKPAIEEAIKNPRKIDNDLVKAQQARRILDRLVGFELSPILWRKVKPSLSAGRVQSVAVRLLVEREREIKAFKPTPSFKIEASFDKKGTKPFNAYLPQKITKEEEVEAFFNECNNSSFKVSSVKKKPAKRKPAPPFTTSTLQQEASRKMGYSVSKTMTLAQRLYEGGKITYMRTDSVNLSNVVINEAEDEIKNEYGKKYSNPRRYTTKSQSAQEAHEAIRPTDISVKSIGGDSDEQRLYELIRKRTIASQMADAELERTTLNIEVSNSKRHFEAKGEVVKFDGFFKAYLESSDEDSNEDEGKDMLPEIDEGEQLNLKKLQGIERFTKHPPRYTEASLVKKLEELGIGRPSTYAPTISTIQKRGYVVKETREGYKRDYLLITLNNGEIKKETQSETTGYEKNKLFPTDTGMVVNDFLLQYFKDIMDYNFTANVEKQFDEIAKGGQKWDKMIDEFYKAFHQEVEETLEKAEKAKGERLLGTDPKTGKEVTAKIGRYGPMVQLGNKDDDEKPKFASLRKGQSIEDITFEEALKLFELPRELGDHNGKKVTASIGRYGPYVKCDNLFASLKEKEGDDPYTIKLNRAIELLEEKKKAQKEKFIKEFKEDETVKVLKGKYGPYVSIGRKNYKIPKDKEPSELTLEECYEIAKKSSNKKGKKKKKG
ncbi:MAG: type I DNA topoisomerase [Flavobacteriales bacterium]